MIIAADFIFVAFGTRIVGIKALVVPADLSIGALSTRCIGIVTCFIKTDLGGITNSTGMRCIIADTADTDLFIFA